MNLKELDKIKENPDNSGIFTDIDGTISEIAPTPGEAFVSEDFKELLNQLSSKYKIVGVISGRSITDAKEMIGVKNIFYSGLHGIETLWNEEYSASVDIETYKSVFKAVMGELSIPDGVYMENKGLVLAFHYRKCPENHQLLEDSLKPLAEKYNLIIKSGKMVFELTLNVKMDKGKIIDKICLDFNLETVFYAGDDVTDLDGFDGVHRNKGVAVGVVGDDSPGEIRNKADICLSSVDEMKEVFKYLLE